MFLLRSRGVAVCLLAAAAFMSIARGELQTTSESAAAPLTLAQALARALERNPDLSVFDPARRAAEAERLQAGVRPNPELGTTLENFAGSGEASGTQSLETTLTVSQLIELGSKRSLRVGVAEGALATLEADYAIARLDVLVETAQRLIDVAQTQTQIALAHRAIELAQQTQAAVERRIQAGATSTAERNRAAIAVARARLDAQRAQGELESRRVALSAMWGETTPDFGEVAADLTQLPALADFTPLAERLKTSPELLRFAAERRLREAEIKLAQAQATPDVNVGVGLRRFEADDDLGLVASLSLPLPLFNRNRGGIAAAQARLSQTEVAREAAYLRTRSVLYGLHRAAQQARSESQTLVSELIPQAEEALTLIQRGYANGRFSFLELADAQRQVLELRHQAIAAQADAHRLDAELERLTGESIIDPAATPDRTPADPTPFGDAR